MQIISPSPCNLDRIKKLFIHLFLYLSSFQLNITLVLVLFLHTSKCTKIFFALLLFQFTVMNIVLYLTGFITLLSYFIKIKLNENISQGILAICFYIIKLTLFLFFLKKYLWGYNQNVDFFMLKCFMLF